MLAKIFTLKIRIPLLFIASVFLFSFSLFIPTVASGLLTFYPDRSVGTFYFSASALGASPDAIAIRVIPNPEHYSAMRWYKEKGFSGSPQSLTVDGYEAVRDGRTVYVNVANISDNELYTNIYLISHTQEADQATADIFGQILSHWRFNANIINSSTCQNNAATACFADADCPQNDYCLSTKAKIVRDTRRLADLADIKKALADYKNKNGRYPILASGSYLPNKTISVWPSWNEALATELGFSLPVDPINELGRCKGNEAENKDFNPVTCWNEKTKQFADSDPADPAINLPAGSNVYIYAVAANGSAFSMCGGMESGLVKSAAEGACAGAGGKSGDGSVIEEKGEADNRAPVITARNIPAGYSGREYVGYVEARDPDGDSLSWSIDTSGSGWTGWSAPPVLQPTAVANQKKIYAKTAGEAGNYNIKITVDDKRGKTNSIVSASYAIKIINYPPVITAENAEYTASSTNPLNYSLTAKDDPLNYSLFYSLFPDLSALKNLAANFSRAGDIFTLKISGIFTPSPLNTFNLLKNIYAFTIEVKDAFNASQRADFSITVINHPPAIDVSMCDKNVRTNNPYSPCQVSASDQDGHALSFFLSGQPAGLSINSKTGVISGTSADKGNYNMKITVADEYGASSEASYALSVNTYCGDGVKQSPNMEGVNEICEDGNTNGDDACDSDCKWTCKSLAASNIKLGEGSGDGVVYDNNNDTNTANNVSGGTYLKLSSVMPTPYIWIANSNKDKVSKIRTYDGYKRTCERSGSLVDCYWDKSVWETRGQLIGVFSVGGNPSRTAVNVETGDVWVANRDSGDIHKLDINGNILKKCSTGSGPRGLAIQKNGDVWVANNGSGNVVKISGDDTSCAILATVNTGGGPYGLAVDSNNNIWVANRGSGKIQKIDSNSLVVSSYSANGIYGITVDPYDNVWAGSYESAGVWKLNNGGVTTIFYNLGYTVTGISADLDGNIWGSGYLNNLVLKINQSGGLVFSKSSGGSNPHGICGDSAGQIWAVNLSSSNTRVFDASGNTLGTYGVSDQVVSPYTYSDMTGLNRAMLLRSGFWTSKKIDGGADNQHWGKISWQQKISNPSEQSIEVYIRADNSTINLEQKNWEKTSDWNAYDLTGRAGRYLQIKIKISSSERGVTPALWDLKIGCE